MNTSRLSGWVGGYLMRQGITLPCLRRRKRVHDHGEWGFWYEGKAAEGILSPDWRHTGRRRQKSAMVEPSL
jgi:hypothetical protein